VVVCAYDAARWRDLGFALESLAWQSRPADEVVLVIDHNPALFARAAEAYPHVTVVENGELRGLSGARNEGLERVTSDVVAFIDDDARADPDWLAELLAQYTDDAVVGVGGAVSPRWWSPRPAWFPAEFDWVLGCSHSGMPDEVTTVRNLIGTNMSFRRSALEQVGGFSPLLGRSGPDAAGCEETELCIRMATSIHGARLIYQPEARVAHTVSPDRHLLSYFLRRCYGEGRSKAVVSGMAGTTALSAERDYLRRTIPQGMRTAVTASSRGEAGALRRAAVLAVGVATTALGYGTGRLRGLRCTR
jgi:cellulose synthase/poly-beta-1,6-N-acetylglucosamine synthase-like glycosyltransferase